MARVIDKDKLITSMAWHNQQGMISCIDDILDIIEAFPTLTPPNKPLTEEQLREMDGEPVWVEDGKHWALIDVEKGGPWDGVPFAVWTENGVEFTYNVEDRNLQCYRRPPEGEA